MASSNDQPSGTRATSAMSLLGTSLQAGGLLAEYQANRNASRYNEGIAIASAEQAIIQGREMERRQRVLGRQILGSIKAEYAASGVALEGSALDVLEASAATAELDALTIRYESKVRAHNFQMQAAAERRARRDAKRAFGFQMAATIIGGVV